MPAWTAWIGPFFTAAIALALLIPVERWMHKHIQGAALLLTNNPQAAVLVYYLLLLPGVILHEGSQWLMAKALRVKVKKFKLWPEKDKSGKIHLGLVEIEKDTDMVRASIIGMIPVISGLAVIGLIATTFFRTDVLMESLSSADLPTMLRGVGDFTATPDFWLWIYLVFAIANAMLPEDHDHINWWLPVGVIAVIVAFLMILDLSILVQAGLEGPVAGLLRLFGLALVMSLVIDLIVMAVISGIELFYNRVLGRELEYT